MRVSKLLYCIGITGCAAAPDDGGYLALRDSVGIRITENTSTARATAWQLSPSPIVELGADEPGGTLYRIRGAVRLSGGGFVVANGGYDELRWYDSAGRFIRKTGREGRDLGEFVSLTWVGRRQGDTVIAWDDRLQRMSHFTADGKFVAAVSVPIRGSVRGGFRDGSLLLEQTRRGDLGFGRRHAILWRLNPNTGVVDSIGTHPGDEQLVALRETNRGFRWSTRSPPFARNGSFVARKQSVLVSSQQHYELLEFATDGRLVGILRMRRPPSLVTTEDVATYREMTIENDWRSSIADLRRRLDEQQYPRTHPAHGNVLVDQRDNLWVQEYRKPWEHGMEWLVFDDMNRMIGMVSTEATLQVLEIGRDYVLAMWTDDSGVERIGVFGLIRP